MKVKRKIITIDEEKCDGCGQCVSSCAEGAIQLIDGKAKLVSEKYCDGLGACLGSCPNNALEITEQEVDEFDEKAVEEYLKAKEAISKTLACGCPSTHTQSFAAPINYGSPPLTPSLSFLTNWPVQIRLIPPKAPFLKGAELLVAADCTAITYPNFHADFISGKVVMIGCPKFDEVETYIQKFTEIFKTADIRTVTVLVMEVPCCQGLPLIVQEGLKLANQKIPVGKITISPQGKIIKKETII
ncbi:MAG: 4Fe-4S binding protein [Desulfobacterota bacterium]|nr:4Fe-4S binding protein [Thermodesulfobacteriota bacterium]